MAFSIIMGGDPKSTRGNGDRARANQWPTGHVTFKCDATADRAHRAAVNIAVGINDNVDPDATTGHGPVVVTFDAESLTLTASCRNRGTARATASGVAWGVVESAIAAAIDPANPDVVAWDGTESDSDAIAHMVAVAATFADDGDADGGDAGAGGDDN